MLPNPPGLPIGPFLPLKEQYKYVRNARESVTRSVRGLTTKENGQEIGEHVLKRTLRHKNHLALYFYTANIIRLQIDNL